MNFQSNHNQLTDIELIALYKERDDITVLGILFKRYKSLVFGISYKYLEDSDESQDAVMQVFEKLLKELKRHEIVNFKSWLHSVTKNHCLMLLRSNKMKRRRSFDEAENSSEVVEMNSLWHPDHNPEKEDTLQHLEKSIQQLGEEQKKCIELFYLEEKSYQDVSQITGYSMLQVKSFIQNGKRNLKILMEKKYAG